MQAFCWREDIKNDSNHAKYFVEDIGQSMLDDLGPYLDGIQGRLQSLKDLNSQAAGTVRISTSDYALGSVIWLKIEPLLKKHPEIKLVGIPQGGIPSSTR